ncbi:MAG: deoxyribose-phosphate aldolase [Clostridia bacterium]|nr:deoxyribose-phosphate aldolase [Clostridia bacterium]
MELREYIDHTLLKPDATPEQIAKLCDEARRYGFKSVCVNSCYAELVASELKGSGVLTCCVVGFPLGAMLTAAKAYEAALCVESGADEIDMVINIGFAKAGMWDRVEEDIAAVVRASGAGTTVKVILETCLLNDAEKRLACECAMRAGAGFVKTSTGFSTGGALPEDVSLMRATVGDTMGVKASGGIRTRDDALRMIAAGATRIGASASIAIVRE